MEKIKRSICLINGSFNIFHTKKKKKKEKSLTLLDFFLLTRELNHTTFSVDPIYLKEKIDEPRSLFFVVTKV